MFGLVAVHHHAALGFEFPCALIHVEHHDVHPQVHRRLLRRQAGAQAGIEEDHQQGLVPPQMLVGEAVALDFERFGHRRREIADVGDTGKFPHGRIRFLMKILQ